MASSNLLKVCKVDTFEFAKFAILSGVDYLGVHVLNSQNIGMHEELITFIRNQKGVPVLVTKINTLNEIKKLIEIYDLIGLQLHSSPNLTLLQQLRVCYPNLILFQTVTDEVTAKTIIRVSDYADWIVYDTSFVGGTGKKNPFVHLPFLMDEKKILKKVFFAGGIDLDSVNRFKKINHAGFDIQSWFRDGDARRYDRLESVCRAIGKIKKHCLSISLTDVKSDLIKKIPSYKKLPNVNFHLDYSDGSLYREFLMSKQEVCSKSLILRGTPHAMHIFQRDANSINQSIQNFKAADSGSITSYFIQYNPSLILENIQKDTNITLSSFQNVMVYYYHKSR